MISKSIYLVWNLPNKTKNKVKKLLVHYIKIVYHVLTIWKSNIYKESEKIIGKSSNYFL
jgi:hypothetical protein